MVDYNLCYGLRTKGYVWPYSCHFWYISLFSAFTIWWVSFQVEPILKKNWGEGPLDVSCDPEAWTLCAFYVVVSILLQLGEKPTSVSS